MLIPNLQDLKVIATSPWIALLSFLLTFVSLLLAIYFYLTGRRRKLPKYAIRSLSLVKGLVNRVTGLEMLYNGRHVENLTAGRLVFWNAGRETIKQEDVASSDPIIMQIEGGAKFLDSKVIFAMNPANQFKIMESAEKTEIRIEFEYIDRHEGLIIQFFHTGTSDNKIALRGTIKGAPPPVRTLVETRFLLSHSWPVPPGYPPATMSRRSAGVALVIVALGGALFTVMFEALSHTRAGPHGWDLALVIGLFAFYILSGIVLVRRRVPRGFEDFEKDF